MSDRVDLQEFIGGFVAEAEELGATSHALLVQIDSANKQRLPSPKAVRDLYRATHTIKGLAGMVGVESIVEVSHALETLLRLADRSGGRLGANAVDVCVQGLQLIGENVRAVAEHRAPAALPDDLLAAIARAEDDVSDVPVTWPSLSPEWDPRLSPGERQQVFQALHTGAKLWTFEFVPTRETAARGLTIAAVRARVEALGEIIKVAPRALEGERRGVAFDFLVVSHANPASLAEAAASDESAIRQLAVVLEAPPQDSAARLDEPGREIAPFGRSFVRVELSRLDELQEQLSRLIVSQFRQEREIKAQAERGTDVRRMREVADVQARQLRDLRRAILRVRMVRVAEVLEPLSLLVRSLTRPGTKEVRLVIEAHETEVDKAVADRLVPALVHLVRNAIDHAIEPVEERLNLHKDRVGTLRVSCSELGGSRLELVVADDGRGVDRKAVGRRAQRPVETDDELLDVLATPGFSTRDVATQTSGRGLGMDIVKRVAVTELGGELAMSTAVGQGSTFRLKVPLTVAIIDVFSFECGPQAFVVPVAGIEEIFEIARDREIQPPARSGDHTPITLLERHGRAMPLISLGALLAIDDGAAARKALVIRQNGELIAFAIDRMIGRHEVVVRPLTDTLVRAPGISGATDLGDGRPTLVLDLSELGTRVDLKTRRA